MRGRKRALIRGLAALLFAAGLCVLAYPHVVQRRYDRRTKAEYRDFVAQTGDSGSEAAARGEGGALYETAGGPSAELYRDMRAYNERICAEGQSGMVDPWSYQQASFDLRDYGFNGDIIGYLSIPRIHVLLPIYLGASEENMAKGAAQLSQTSLPIGGESCNTVICGHRGYWGAEMFKYLVDVEEGDMVYLSNLWYTMSYKVTGTAAILDDDMDKLKIQEGRDLLSLFTCYYQGGRKDRFVVFCERQS